MSFLNVARCWGCSCWCSRFMLLALFLPFGPLGCQLLFHDDGAPLKGQTVNLALTMPETPPPASRPLSVQPDPAIRSTAKTPPPLDTRLLPQQAPVEQGSSLLPTPAPVVANSPYLRSMVTKADTVLVERTITEDTSLRGTVLIKGSLVVAPQATLRIEAGTSLRFQRQSGALQNPRLVVQGRLVCAGTAQKPVFWVRPFMMLRCLIGAVCCCCPARKK